ncbi:uracil-DNA glycosylase [Terriglobus tenax]|uniref:uracil-DNA glycosylase n=1 Tax=Terriglobus tenax TaxID=1111115 RepID=UPI0021E00545|nr:uracil-DNA glycosylase [Terriglobus tenax]
MSVTPEAAARLRAYLAYFRDLGVHEFYRWSEPAAQALEPAAAVEAPAPSIAAATGVLPPATPPVVAPPLEIDDRELQPAHMLPPSLREPPAPALRSFDDLVPLPATTIPAADRPAALKVIQDEIGDCTRCPLAYGGRRKIVFADGDPNTELMFIGEGPGADEDAQGLPFVGKAGQLLNNMINAMGLKREQVYIANIVKCRPPANRTPEYVEASTCSQFLIKQIDVVQPKVIVALGSTAATYLLGRKQALAGLRGSFHSARGAKVAVTYHPAFLLREPRMKGEAWKDLQMVMRELGLKPPVKQ